MKAPNELVAAKDLPMTAADNVDILCVENGELKKKKETQLPDNVLTYDKENPPAGVENGVFVGGGSGGGGNIVHVKFIKNGDGYTCDHTYDELAVYVDAGALIYATVADSQGQLIRSFGTFYFHKESMSDLEQFDFIDVARTRVFYVMADNTVGTNQTT